MIPMLRVLSNGTVLAISLGSEKKEAVGPPPCFSQVYNPKLPPIMSEGTIGLGHPMGVFLLLYRRAPVIGRIDEFGGQFLFHRFFTALPSGLNEPAHAERKAPLRPHFDGNLIRRSADAAGADFDRGPSIFNRPFENSQ